MQPACRQQHQRGTVVHEPWPPNSQLTVPLHTEKRSTPGTCALSQGSSPGPLQSRVALHLRLPLAALQPSNQSETRCHSAHELYLAPGVIGGSGTWYQPILLVCKADMQTRAAPPEKGLWVVVGKEGRELLGLCRAQRALSETGPPVEPQKWGLGFRALPGPCMKLCDCAADMLPAHSAAHGTAVC